MKILITIEYHKLLVTVPNRNNELIGMFIAAMMNGCLVEQKYNSEIKDYFFIKEKSQQISFARFDESTVIYNDEDEFKKQLGAKDNDIQPVKT